MVVTTSLQFLASSWIFMRALVKVAIGLYEDNNAKRGKVNLSAIGLEQDKITDMDDLPTAVEIKSNLPTHCFNSSVLTSFYYAIKDVIMIVITYYVARQLMTVRLYSMPILDSFGTCSGSSYATLLGYPGYPVYCGHDCGHNSFSAYPLLNDTVGIIYHGFLHCPFYMWKLSHKHHHKYTNNLDKDEVFYPLRAKDPGAGGFTLPGFGLGVGWFGYLALGYTPRNVCHWTLGASMYQGHIFGCIMSLVSVAFYACLSASYISSHGAAAFVGYYAVPLFIFASYCVIITFLHHTELTVPWMDDSKWDFVRGQLCSVDRDYGIVHSMIHNIGTHQMHHMFSKLPHYHLEEATSAFRKKYPELVRVCNEPIMPSFLRMFRLYDTQGVVPNDAMYHYYKDE